jgi:hypothetical protein
MALYNGGFHSNKSLQVEIVFHVMDISYLRVSEGIRAFIHTRTSVVYNVHA